MAKTCVHNGNPSQWAEQHNMRDTSRGYVIPDYVHQELSNRNEYWQLTDAQGQAVTMQTRLADVKRRYQASVGQKMQARAKPYKESIVVIDKQTTMAQLKGLVSCVEQTYGVTALSIAIHRDEGYLKAHHKPNLHAHIIWDWTYREGWQIDGRSVAGIKAVHNKGVLRHLQDLAAASLQMERGTKSDRQHLSRVVYAAQQEERRLNAAMSAMDAVYAETRRLQSEAMDIDAQISRSKAHISRNEQYITHQHERLSEAKRECSAAIAERDAVRAETTDLTARVKQMLHWANDAAVWAAEMADRVRQGLMQITPARAVDITQRIATGIDSLPEPMQPMARQRWAVIRDNVPAELTYEQVMRLCQGGQVSTPAGTWQVVKGYDGSFSLSRPRSAESGGSKANQWVMD